MKTILVLGGSGMLGSACVRRFSRNEALRVVATQHHDRTAPNYFDARTGASELFAKFPGASIINCIAVLSGAFNRSHAQAFRDAVHINAVFPHELGIEAAKTGSRVIHVSTDGVFSGANGPYDEAACPDATDAYGMTKALGEPLAQNVLSIRCSLIGLDSTREKGLVEWFLSAAENSAIDGFTDVHWNGVTTQQFAEMCERVFDTDAFDALRCATPVYHFCPNPALTKYDLLRELQRATGKAVTIHRKNSGLAPRNRLLATRFDGLRELYPSVEHWSGLLRSMLEERN